MMQLYLISAYKYADIPYICIHECTYWHYIQPTMHIISNIITVIYITNFTEINVNNLHETYMVEFYIQYHRWLQQFKVPFSCSWKNIFIVIRFRCWQNMSFVTNPPLHKHKINKTLQTTRPIFFKQSEIISKILLPKTMSHNQ